MTNENLTKNTIHNAAISFHCCFNERGDLVGRFTVMTEPIDIRDPELIDKIKLDQAVYGYSAVFIPDDLEVIPPALEKLIKPARNKPKTWGIPCQNCGYRWCYHARACIARQIRAEKRKQNGNKNERN